MTHEDDKDLEQTFTFDKFMDDILIKESVRSPILTEETPAREYVKRYAERAANRIKYTKVK